MFTKIIGAGLGAKAAEQTSAFGGPMGAVIGAAAPMLIRRLSIPAMLAIAAGGYAYKKYSDKKAAADKMPKDTKQHTDLAEVPDVTPIAA